MRVPVSYTTNTRVLKFWKKDKTLKDKNRLIVEEKLSGFISEFS